MNKEEKRKPQDDIAKKMGEYMRDILLKKAFGIELSKEELDYLDGIKNGK